MENVVLLKVDHSVTIPRFEITIHEDTVESDVLAIFKLLRKKWVKDEQAKTGILSRALSGGITNKLYAFWHETNPHDMVVIKIYGLHTDAMIDREAEVETMIVLNKHDCGPKLYAIFENGLCYEFLQGETLTTDNVRSAAVYPLIARELAHAHKCAVPAKHGDGSAMWKKMKLFCTLLNDIFVGNVRLRDKLAKKFGFTLEKAVCAIEELEGILKKQKMPIGFCHNDLLLGNVMYDKTTNKITFIDFEYAFPNYLPYDIANHFNEFAGIDEPDFTKCPGPEFRQYWIEIYLEAMKPERVYKLEDFERWVYLCTPASHLFWALWAAVQANLSDIDFDYVNYVGLRFLEYEKCMARLHGRKILTAMIGSGF